MNPGSASAKKIGIIAAVGLALAIVVYVLVAQKRPAPQVTFNTLAGKAVSLQSLRGKVVLVSFWATTCPGCIKEMPELVSTYNQYHSAGFEVVAVAMSYDPPNYVLQFVAKHALPFKVALDVDSGHARAFGDVRLTPTAFLIGTDGNIVQQTIGELNFQKLHAFLDQALALK